MVTPVRSALVLVCVWFCFSFPGLSWFVVLPGLGLGLALMIDWINRAARPSHPRRPRPRVLVITGLIIAVMISGIALNLPLKARFAISRPFYNHAVAAGALEPPSDEPYGAIPCPSVIGLYGVADCWKTDAGYFFADPLGTDLVDDAGFFFTPGGTIPPSTAGWELRDAIGLGGGWYAYQASW